jgi:hypothetical protein
MTGIDEQVRSLLGGGWAGLEEGEPKVDPRHADEQYRVDRMLYAAFSDGPGAEALAHLRDMTIHQPAFVPGSGVDAIMQGFTREGQNSIVRYIDMRMRRAEQGPPSAQKGIEQ